MSCCTTCLKYVGQRRTHGEGEACSVSASFWCSQCGCFGHTTSECDEVTHVDRPESLEDIIRRLGGEEELIRWGITTTTPIQWTKPTLADKEREIANINTIEIRYREGQRDKKIREVMRTNKIATVHKMDDNIQLLRKWAVEHGKKVCLIQEK